MNNLEQELIKRMVLIYGTTDYDWMGTLISKDNPLTYHHIIKRKHGDTTLSNGALLTKRSHEKLNKLYYRNPGLFDAWQMLFLEINRSQAPLTEELISSIRELRYSMSETLYTRKLKR